LRMRELQPPVRQLARGFLAGRQSLTFFIDISDQSGKLFTKNIILHVLPPKKNTTTFPRSRPPDCGGFFYESGIVGISWRPYIFAQNQC
jgi:hypothetical protein